MENSKMKWYTLAFMAFSTVWGFGNVLQRYPGYIQLDFNVRTILRTVCPYGW